MNIDLSPAQVSKIEDRSVVLIQYQRAEIMNFTILMQPRKLHESLRFQLMELLYWKVSWWNIRASFKRRINELFEELQSIRSICLPEIRVIFLCLRAQTRQVQLTPFA